MSVLFMNSLVAQRRAMNLLFRFAFPNASSLRTITYFSLYIYPTKKSGKLLIQSVVLLQRSISEIIHVYRLHPLHPRC